VVDRVDPEAQYRAALSNLEEAIADLHDQPLVKRLLEQKESVALLARAHLPGSLEGSGPAYSLAAQILQVVENEAWAVSLPQVAIGARIMVAREAITRFRKDLHLDEALMDNLRPATETEIRALHPWGGGRENWPISYGFIGLLDYISTGDPEKILSSILRRAVKKTLRAWPQIVKEALK
jgi:hypothetical protein